MNHFWQEGKIFMLYKQLSENESISFFERAGSLKKNNVEISVPEVVQPSPLPGAT